MLLDKFKNRFSYNFLAIYGWARFLFLSSKYSPDIFHPQAGTPMAIITLMIFAADIIFILLTFFIYLFERFSFKRITNEKFLNNKFVSITQHIGFIFATLPFLMILILIVFIFFA